MQHIVIVKAKSTYQLFIYFCFQDIEWNPVSLFYCTSYRLYLLSVGGWQLRDTDAEKWGFLFALPILVPNQYRFLKFNFIRMFWDYICKPKHGRQNNIKKTNKHAQTGGDLQSRAKTQEKRFTVHLFNPMSKAKIQKHSKTTKQAKKQTWEDWRLDFEEIYPDRFMSLLLQLQQPACGSLTESIMLQKQVKASKFGK